MHEKVAVCNSFDALKHWNEIVGTASFSSYCSAMFECQASCNEGRDYEDNSSYYQLDTPVSRGAELYDYDTKIIKSQLYLSLLVLY